MGDKKQNCFGPGYIYIYMCEAPRGQWSIYRYIHKCYIYIYTLAGAYHCIQNEKNTTTMFTTVITNAGLDLREKLREMG